MIYDRGKMESDQVDYSLIGILRIVEIIFIKYPKTISDEDREKFLSFLLKECLFKIENGILVDKALYKNHKVRKIAIDLCLSMLDQKYSTELNMFIDLTYEIFKSMRWRSNTKKSWYCNYNASAALNASKK